jgi:TetR/AcrR family transcriptional regulator, mexJK operon transcriptional repressor
MMDTTRMKRDDRRAQIIAVAREAFIREGYAAVSMSKISETVGGSKRTLYSLFPSKKDLFFTVIDLECTRLFDHVFELGPSLTDLRSAVVLFAQRFLSRLLSEDNIALQRMVIAESVHFPEVGQALFEFAHQRGIERLTPYLQQAMDTGLLRPGDSRETALRLLEMCTSSYLERLRLWNVAEKVTAAEIEKGAHTAMICFLAVYGTDVLAKEVRRLT